MDTIARFAGRISTLLFASFLVGCGALPIGIAPTNYGNDGCGPPSDELNYGPTGYVDSNDPLYDRERIERCENFYKEAEQQGKEALSQDLEEYMGPTHTEGEDGSKEQSIVIK